MPEVLVLLVEDEALLAFAIQQELSDAGYKVVLVADGAAAMEALAEQGTEIKALLTDIRLPGKITGWDVAHHARKDSPNIAVIYMSGDSAADWRVHGVPESMMLSKPFALAQLTTAVSQLLNAVPPAV